MNTHRTWFRSSLILIASAVLTTLQYTETRGQKRKPPPGGRVAVVVDERLSALRLSPNFSGNLLQRTSRGRLVAILGHTKDHDGVVFYRVKVTRRTIGWMQQDAIVSATNMGDDSRLLRLIHGSENFDRIARARIFLDTFPKSPLRPAVLLLWGDAAEEAAARLSREASRRLDKKEMAAGGVPMSSYFLNYIGLDRYNRQGIKFILERDSKQFHYDGKAWREIVRRYKSSPEAAAANKRLELLAAITSN